MTATTAAAPTILQVIFRPPLIEPLQRYFLERSITFAPPGA
jgi:hypothetical protein